MMDKISMFFTLFFVTLSGLATGQGTPLASDGFVFTDEVVLKTTSVKNQHRTGTCWSFGALSFLESEMLRLGKPEADLSEMFVVHHAYAEKARRYVRMHGSNSFGAGGAFHDVTNMMRIHGIVPEEVYTGLNYGEEKHVHGELDETLKDQVDAMVKNPNRKLSQVWFEPIRSTLDAYLGELPQRFDYQGKSYSPQSYLREYTGLNMEDYVEITSFTHHPFYSRFILEIPDNWSWDAMYNVPLDEMEEIIDNALKKGYSVAWASDVSEKGFLTGNKGVAMVPVKRVEDMTNAEILRWEKLSDREKEEETFRLDKPVPELDITQELRQLEFDNYMTTDDHGMHIVGIAKDQTGKEWYKVKNSWGDYNKNGGYFYASKAYVKYKTTCLMVHKEAIPQHIRRKLDL